MHLRVVVTYSCAEFALGFCFDTRANTQPESNHLQQSSNGGLSYRVLGLQRIEV